MFLRWLETDSTTFQDLDFDRSLQPHYIGLCQIHGIKNCPFIGELVAVNVVAQ